MGMFDSFIDESGHEWQTKAFGCSLERWRVGDAVPDAPPDCQVEVIGGGSEWGRFVWSLATIREGRFEGAGEPRKAWLTCIDYTGVRGGYGDE